MKRSTASPFGSGGAAAAIGGVTAAVLLACSSSSRAGSPSEQGTASGLASAAALTAAATIVPATRLPPPLPPAPAYPWQPQSTDRLDARFPAPRGFTRAGVEVKSFGAFLRALPLLAPGQPVVDYAGHVVHGGDDPRIAAVVDIDIGRADLQQCADAVVRMNGEWHYGRGDRAISYTVSSGTALAYPAYLAGARAFASGNRLLVQPSAARRADDHTAFRAYLDEVFAWANTASLRREGTPAPFADIRPGDFFVMSGKPYGHAVLVLDVARSDAGQTALLLGQSYMPAQSFQVLSPAGRGAWFVVEPGANEVDTPFWIPFPLESLRRLP